jgi:hypothetical protein
VDCGVELIATFLKDRGGRTPGLELGFASGLGAKGASSEC